MIYTKFRKCIKWSYLITGVDCELDYGLDCWTVLMNWIGSIFELNLFMSPHLQPIRRVDGHMFVLASTMACCILPAVTHMVALLNKRGCLGVLCTTFRIQTHASKVISEVSFVFEVAAIV